MKRMLNWCLALSVNLISLSLGAKMPNLIAISKTYNDSLLLRLPENQHVNRESATFPLIEKIARFDGEFHAIKKVGDTVNVHDVIGEIYYGGIWNKQYASVAGKIAYMLPSGLLATQNKTRIFTLIQLPQNSLLSWVNTL
jgi:hypothetical protein